MTHTLAHRRVTAVLNTIRAARHRAGFLAIMLAGIAAVSHADNPVGLNGRVTIGAYMNNYLPTTTSDPMPTSLALTGVFIDVPARIPHPGFVPYDVNAPLWTDGAEKSRFIAIPYDSADPANPVTSPRIGFARDGAWTFPNGTVLVKNFDMRLDERNGASNPVRRLETRILVRNADGSIRGAAYRWQLPNSGTYSDADIVGSAQSESLVITQADGSTRTQEYYYPGEADCARCHTANAGLVLSARTAQLNGNFTYPGTGRTDNQLHTWDQLGMFSTTLSDPATYPKAVAIDNTSATLELRIRSYLASNCSHCHRPGGEGPYFDMRFETPTQNTNITGVFGGLIRDDLANSRIYVRDSMQPDTSPMPPLSRNVPDPRVVGKVGVAGVYSEWVNYSYDVMSATRLSPTQVRLVFNRPLEPSSVIAASNYALDNGISVSQAVADADPAAVILITSPLALATAYTVTINYVKEAQAPQNPIWPNTTVSFTTPGPMVPDAPVLTGIQAGNGDATLSFSPPAFDGGVAVSGYNATCTSAEPHTVRGNGTASPVTVTGLTNGNTYTCSVQATNSQGSSAASNALTVTSAAPVPTLAGAFSRKTHGAGGTFDLPLNQSATLYGPITFEPRVDNSHRIVFRFDIPVNSSGNVTSTSGSVTAVAVNNEIIVTLAGVGDNQRATISLTNVNGAGVNVAVSLGFLVGDVNSAGDVNALDVSAVKAHTGQPVNNSNFWFDVNCSGNVTAADVAAVKARFTTTFN